MNKKIFIFCLGLLMLFSILTPVMAKSKNKSPATATVDPFTVVVPDLPIVWVTDGGIEHLEYLKLEGTINIKLGSGSIIPATFVDICVGTYNPKSSKGVYKFDEIWTLPGGTFE